MEEPEKPFACTMPDCGMTFTNEDHLNVHTKKHDMVLQFGCDQKAAVFVADQTPTPTRFIRNCEEVGLFQDLQNVNPFDEGFKRAIETRQGMLTLESCGSAEELHTPQMFPILDADSFTATNNHTNITISRSSSDENGAIKEFETTRISKLTNEVTTISRIIEKHDDTPKNKDTLKNSVSYTNNVIKIRSNVEIRKDTDVVKDVPKDVNKGSNEKHTSISKDVYDRLQVDIPPMMSQKSIDFVVDSLTTDYVNEKPLEESSNADKLNKVDKGTKVDITNQKENTIKDVESDAVKQDDFEVILKLPTGKEIKLVKAPSNSDEKQTQINAKDVLKKVITEKVDAQKMNKAINIIPNIIPTIAGGTLIPVSIVNTNIVGTNLANASIGNTPLVSSNVPTTSLVNANIVTNANVVSTNTNLLTTNLGNSTLVANINSAGLMNKINYVPKLPIRVFDKKTVRRKSTENSNKKDSNSKKSKEMNIDLEKHMQDMQSKSAASKRYRAKLKQTMLQQSLENKQLREANQKLTEEKAILQALIIDHMKQCPCPDDLRKLREKSKVIVLDES